MTIYDEATAQRHRAVGYDPAPDRQRPGYVDHRVVLTACTKKIAVIGHRQHRPALIVDCAGCFR
jgi:hypothetical protein